MYVTCGTYGAKCEVHAEYLSENLMRRYKRPLGRLKSGWKDNITMDL
jgi:hypothetical protein